MKILYISSSVIPSRSANSIHVMKMCQALAHQGHDVELTARRGEADAEIFKFYGVEENFRITYLPWPGIRLGGLIYGAHVARLLKRAKRERHIDIVYARNVHGIRAALHQSYPSIYEVHNAPDNAARQRLEAKILSSPHLKRLVTISDALRAEYCRIFPWLEDKVEVVVAHDAADPPLVEQSTPLAAQPGEHSGRPNALQIGYVGHLYPGRGIDLIVSLAESTPDADFHLIGGTESDVAHWRARAPLPNIFFHGFVAPSQIPDYHRRLHVLLLPYQRKVAVHGGKGDTARWMSPLKMFEYMSSGKPIIASDLPVLGEVLKHGENCLLAKPDSVEDWAAAIKQLQADPDLRAKIGEAARSEFLAHYTWNNRAQKVLQDIVSAPS